MSVTARQLAIGCLWAAVAFAGGCGSGGSPATTVEADPGKFSSDRITAARAEIPEKAPAEPATEMPLLLSQAIREWGVRETTVDALARIGSDSVDPLIQSLGDPDPGLRADAARALALMGPQAEKAIPALIQSLRDPDRRVRIGAARALGQIGPAARAAMPALIELLRQAEAEERSS